MCVIAEIAYFQQHVGSKLLFYRQVVLIYIRRAQFRVDEVHSAPGKWNVASRVKIEVLRRRLRWERIRRGSAARTRGRKRILQTAGRCARSTGEDVRETIKWRLPVELQIVLAL